MKTVMHWSVAIVVFLAFPFTTTAAERHSVRLADGSDMEFALALPEGFEPQKRYPAVLAISGGEQTIEGAISFVERFFEEEASRRGYIVFGAATEYNGVRPIVGRFADDTLLPQFMDAMLAQYNIEQDKFHIAGFSAGAEAAFRVAVRHPHRFRSLTAMSSYAHETDQPSLGNLRGIAVQILIGGSDVYYHEGAAHTRDLLQAAGIPVYFEIIPEAAHALAELRTPDGQRHLWDKMTSAPIN
jgi:predicted esterase